MKRISLVAFAAACSATGIDAKPGQGVVWSGAWGYAAAAPDPDDAPLPPGTYRYRARLTQQGASLTLTFSNAEGTAPITIADATVAVAERGDGLGEVAGTARHLRFADRGTAYLPVGRSILSNPVPFAAEVGTDVIVSVTFSSTTRPARTNLAMPMEFEGKPIQARPYLSMIAVGRAKPGCTIVTFGDSITDGFGVKSPSIRGWPGRLAERFSALDPAMQCGVVNVGVSGNRLLQNGRGVAAVERFWRDVASVPGATHLILLEGINDIGNAKASDRPAATPQEIVSAYREIVLRAHSLGIRVLGGTMTPALGTWNIDPAKDALRASVNSAIRHDGIFDAVIDFDLRLRDPASPSHLAPAFDSGDHIHPSDAGYAAMGDAIDLAEFRTRKNKWVPDTPSFAGRRWR